jgi:hypothetical protein
VELETVDVNMIRSDEKLDDFRAMLLGQLQVTGEALPLRATLMEPPRRLLRVLSHRVLALGWSRVLASFAWRLARDLLSTLRSDAPAAHIRRALADGMIACLLTLNTVVEHPPASARIREELAVIGGRWHRQ